MYIVPYMVTDIFEETVSKTLPTRKETNYSDKTLTFASHSKTIQKVVRPTRTLRQQ